MSTILGSLIADAGWPQAYASPATLLDRFALEIEEYKRTGGPRIVDELVDFTTLIIERGPVPGDSVGDEALEEEAQLLGKWPELFPPQQPIAFPFQRHAKAAAFWLVEAHIRACDQRGSEVRVDVGGPLVSMPNLRTPIDSRRWKWRHVISTKIKRGRHINSPELRGALLTINWRLRSVFCDGGDTSTFLTRRLRCPSSPEGGPVHDVSEAQYVPSRLDLSAVG